VEFSAQDLVLLYRFSERRLKVFAGHRLTEAQAKCKVLHRIAWVQLLKRPQAPLRGGKCYLPGRSAILLHDDARFH
jgi:hypothetical protein